MSESFYIHVPEAPLVNDQLTALNVPDLICPQWEEIPEGRWPDEAFHFVRRNLSINGITVGYAEESMQVILPFPANCADLDLAFKFVEAFAAGGQPVQLDSGESSTLAELHQRFTPQWLEQENEEALREALEPLTSGKPAVSIGGLIREMWVGPKYLARVAAEGGQAQTSAKILEALHQLQWLANCSYAPATTLFSKSKVPFSACLLQPEEKTFLAAADYVALKHNEHTRFVPYDKVPQLFCGRGSLFDELQFIVEPIQAGLWPALLEQAKSFEAFPLGPAVSPGASWWQFWK